MKLKEAIINISTLRMRIAVF